MIDMPALPGDQLFREGALAEGGPMEMFEGDYQISEDGGGTFVATNTPLSSVFEPNSLLLIISGIMMLSGVLSAKSGLRWISLRSREQWSSLRLS